MNKAEAKQQTLKSIEKFINSEINKLKSNADQKELTEAIETHMTYAYPSLHYIIHNDNVIQLLDFNL